MYFTSHQVAKMLGVSLPTVVNWTNDGRLHAHRTPGGHRRISQVALVRFAETFSYPLPGALLRDDGPRRVLVVDAEPDFCDMVGEAINLRGDGWAVRTADTAFQAGLELGRFRPDAVLMDLAMPDLDPVRLAERLATDPALAQIRLLGLSTVADAHLEARVSRAGYAAVRPKSVDLDELIGLIEDLIDR